MRILYIDIDSLRPDHLGCYGYHRNTSPNIDAVATQGVRFNNVYCSDAPCLPSRTALMSGRFGIHTGVVGHGGTAADLRLEGAGRGFRHPLGDHSLPAFLKQQGLHTVYVGGFGERHSTWTFYAGFREIHDTGKGGMESAEEVSPTALEWIGRNAQQDDWFLHVNYWDPHTPYRSPEEFGSPFANDPLPDWITPDVLDQHRQSPGPHTARNINMYDDATDPRYPRHPGEVHDMEGLRRFFDGYDCGVAHADAHVGHLLKALEVQGVLDDTAIIISADHGENLGELGLYAEHATADRPTCNIPLVVRWPGCPAGHVDDGLHYHLDLPPTMAELFDAEPKAAWDGSSFAPAILRGEECGQEHLVISQCAHVCQRSVRWDSYLYIRSYHDGFHLFPEEMLFDLDVDPHEQHNLADTEPNLCLQARDHLVAWHDHMMATMPAGYSEDPLQTVMREGGPFHTSPGRVMTDYAKFLEKTGRGKALEELRARHPGKF